MCCVLCEEMADDTCDAYFCVAITGGASGPVHPEGGDTEDDREWMCSFRAPTGCCPRTVFWCLLLSLSLVYFNLTCLPSLRFLLPRTLGGEVHPTGESRMWSTESDTIAVRVPMYKATMTRWNKVLHRSACTPTLPVEPFLATLGLVHMLLRPLALKLTYAALYSFLRFRRSQLQAHGCGNTSLHL